MSKINPNIKKAKTIPSEFYYSEKKFQEIKELLFAKQWQFICDTTKLQNHGAAYPYSFIEDFIEGKELTVAIVGESTYPAIEIISPNEFYDFSAKYDGIGTKYIPANLSSTETKKLSEICLKAFKSLGCSGWGRVDLIKSKNDGILYILEVNTVPGMTETSLVPKAARLAELSFNDLLVEIIKTSID